MDEVRELSIYLSILPDSEDGPSVTLSFSDEDADNLAYIQPAAEFLAYELARRSALEFEQALGVLVKGAMDWRTKKVQ